MNILFLADNFPPELNAIASRVYERACYWVAWGHEVAVITSVPNFPDGKVFDGYRNRWYQVESVNGIRVVRVKTFVAKNEGLVLRTLDFLSYMFSSFWAGLIEPRLVSGPRNELGRPSRSGQRCRRCKPALPPGQVRRLRVARNFSQVLPSIGW